MARGTLGGKFSGIATRYEQVFPGDRLYSAYPNGPRYSRHVFTSAVKDGVDVIIGETGAIGYMLHRLVHSTRCRIEYRTMGGDLVRDRRSEPGAWAVVASLHNGDGVAVIARDRGVPDNLYRLTASVFSDVDTLIQAEPEPVAVATIDEALAWISRRSGVLYGREET